MKRAKKLNNRTAIINTADAPADTCAPSGMFPSLLTFQIWTAKVSACLKIFKGLVILNGFQFVKSKAGALWPAV